MLVLALAALLFVPCGWRGGARLRLERGEAARRGGPSVAAAFWCTARGPALECDRRDSPRGKNPRPNTRWVARSQRTGTEPLASQIVRRFARRRWAVSFNPWPTEIVLVAKSAARRRCRVRRVARWSPPAWEAEAVARPDAVIHPVDLGASSCRPIGSCCAEGQAGVVEGAAMCRTRAMCRRWRVTVWFQSAPTATARTRSRHSCKIVPASVPTAAPRSSIRPRPGHAPCEY